MSIARAEIQQTLKLAQDEAERDIAFFRLIIFSLTALIATGISLSPLGNNWFFPQFNGACVGTSAAIWLGVRRLGAVLWLRVLSVLFDIAAPSVIFYLGLIDDVGGDGRDIYSAINITAALFALMVISQLRISGITSVVCALASILALFGIFHATFGVHPFLIFTGVLFLFCGYVGWSSARRTRRSLERFARLHLLKRYLPSIAVDRVLDERMDEALSVGGQQVTVTLMSTDLRGFTAMSEALSPAQVVEQLNAYHAMMLEEVRRQGGILDKFIGDGMLAVFGLSLVEGTLTSAPDAGAQAAVACSRAMLDSLERLNATRAGQGLSPLKIGVGVHTGPVIAGNIGVPGHRIEFTVIGDAVNTAARLEGLTKEAGAPVLISGETARRLPELSGLTPRPAVTLRGKTQPLELFVLAARSPVVPEEQRVSSR
jgi:class 3 adenylate cyclase